MKCPLESRQAAALAAAGTAIIAMADITIASFFMGIPCSPCLPLLRDALDGFGRQSVSEETL
jgi:hypothetical protein